VLHLNAADYGVPQLRERVIVVAHRDGHECPQPTPTHAPASSLEVRAGFQPYRTAWDAIGDLDSTDGAALAVTGRWADLLPSIPEGHNYQWHTRKGRGRKLFPWRSKYWSFLLKLAKDQPAWTIQALPGPATGPFHWLNRRLSVRELARLQTFPDHYEFIGDYRAAHRQIGNAVPPALGELLGRWVRRSLFGDRVDLKLRLAPSARPGCPPPEPHQPVHKKYLELEGDHEDHPGTGCGPGARRRNSTAAAAE
jgi:DNA (cytosine-5)-methyltransferase 1